MFTLRATTGVLKSLHKNQLQSYLEHTIEHAKDYQAIVQQLKIHPKRVPKLVRQVHQEKSLNESWGFFLGHT